MKIKVKDYHNKQRPHLKFEISYREIDTDGVVRRARKFFRTKEEATRSARKKNREKDKSGTEGAEFPTELRVMAQNGAGRLKPFKKTIDDAVDHYVAYLEASEKSCTVTALVDELITAKKADGASLRHLQDLKSRLGIFAEQFDGQMVATITTKEIDDWLRSLAVGPVTRNHYRRLVILAFNFAVQRGYAPANPAGEKKTTKAKERWKRPHILTVAQAARLLESATPDVLPYIAIGLFAGLRRAEIERLNWNDIDFESGQIEVEAEDEDEGDSEQNKTGWRFVKIEPNLREWLLPVRKHRGPVTPDDFQKQFDQTRKAAGITAWPSNALRHSFASYWLAVFKDINALALQMGNSPAMIKKHYLGLVKPKKHGLPGHYWELRPATTEKVVHITRHNTESL